MIWAPASAGVSGKVDAPFVWFVWFVWFVVPILQVAPPRRSIRLSTNHTNKASYRRASSNPAHIAPQSSISPLAIAWSMAITVSPASMAS